MTDDERDLYEHMTGDDLGSLELPEAPLTSVSPRFSLAYLRRGTDPVALLTCEGRITFLNDPARVFLGIDAVEAAHGRDLWEYWPEDESAVLSEGLLSVARGAPLSLPVSCPVSDDAVKRHSLTSTPVVDTDGRVESVFVVISDPD